MGKTLTAIILLLIIAGLSILDLFMNSISLIPLIGDAVESFSEMIIEGISFVLTIVLATLVGKGGND